MAPRGGRARAGTGRIGGRGTARIRPRPENHAPDAYRDLLSSTISSTNTPHGEESRPLKRRKVVGKPRDARTGPSNSSQIGDATDYGPSPASRLQTIVDDSEDSDSDIEFEDVELGPALTDPPDPHPVQEKKSLDIIIGAQPAVQQRANARKRKHVTSAEKARRLDVHKMHFSFLLYHTFYRNHWCNDARTQAVLKKLVQPRLVTMLHPDHGAAQTQRARLFKDALSQVCDMWYIKFTITSLGIRRPQWFVDGNDIGKFKLPTGAEKPMERSDFRRAAYSLEGSADLSAQLFCALLRAVGVEARLVCSLQPLGFAAAAELATPQKKPDQKVTVYANESDEEHDSRTEPASNKVTIASPIPLRRIGRLGQSRVATNAPLDLGKPPPSLVMKVKRLERPGHPIFWIEAFNDAQQKWIPVDPVATKSVNKPAQIEPAFNDSQNCMSYVIAFEEDGTAKDVTRRYAKSYNAKTRKLRVDSTEGGQRWLKRALKPFRKYRLQDRDQIEDADLAAKEASEGMPRNVQDFKDHPYYALDRHLKRNEIIHPKQETGRINIGTSAATRFEPVYRRRDVHVVRSSDKWFRLGRELKVGEQPLKYARPRQVRGREPTVDLDAEDAGTGLYALFQTNVYVPPAVVNGRIPKNTYGNLDVYVPSMVPPGAVHIRSADAKKAARLLNIDYADAVTGFQFKGRHGTAVTEGIIVAAEYRAAVEAVLEGVACAQEEAMEARRSAEALRLWKRFFVGLRVVQRVKTYRHNGEDDEEDRLANEQFQKDLEEEMAQYGEQSSEAGGGGFLVGGDDDEEMPIRRGGRVEQQASEDDYDEYEDENYGESGGFLPASREEDEQIDPVRDGSIFGLENFDIPAPAQHLDEDHDDYGGGFLFDEDEVPARESIILESAPGATIKRQEMQETSAQKISDDASFMNEDIEDINNNGAGRQHPMKQISIPTKAAKLDNNIQGNPPPPPALVAAFPLTATALPEPETTITSIPREIEKETKLEPPTPVIMAEDSSEYDDDLPLEDPEDEDAEPEWLL